MLKTVGFACSFSLLAGAAALADALSGTREIALLSQDGDRIVIGEVRFEPKGDAVVYAIRWAEAPFTDHFLSMRPFKCLEGAARHWCHVPYPYEIRRQVSADDLTDLEYDLLFLWKGAADYGIDMWNGVYYRLSLQDDRITGSLHEFDMGMLAIPPDAGDLRPVAESDLHEADADSHWLPVVVIE